MPYKIKPDNRMHCGALEITRREDPIKVKMNIELPMAGHKTHLMFMITNFDDKYELIYIEKEEGQAIVDYISSFYNL